MVEEVVQAPAKDKAKVPRGLAGHSKPRRLYEISGDSEERLPMPIGEFSRVLGGGIVPGSVVLIGGDPGIGKSTLLLQATMEMAVRETVLYVSGEESERQIKMRALRLLRQDGADPGPIPDDLYLVTETNLSEILDHVNETRPPFVGYRFYSDRLYP